MTQSIMPFINSRQGRDLFAFKCPKCGETGELGIPTKGRKLVRCPRVTTMARRQCNAHFIVQLPRAGRLNDGPTLEYVFGFEKRRMEK